jgi:hypothetical protein
MRDKNTYRLIVTVRVTDAEYKNSYSFDGNVDLDISQLDNLGYIASNIACPLGRSAGIAAMRGEGIRVAPEDQAQPELITE